MHHVICSCMMESIVGLRVGEWEWGRWEGAEGGAWGHLVGGLGWKSKNKPSENEVMAKLFPLMMD